jgi:hypothetical protein
VRIARTLALLLLLLLPTPSALSEFISWWYYLCQVLRCRLIPCALLVYLAGGYNLYFWGFRVVFSSL